MLRAMLAAVIVMGVMILLGTAVLISTVVQRATHRQAPGCLRIAMPHGAATDTPMLSLDQPPGSRITSVTRQSDTLVVVTLTGGGKADRLLIWDLAAGRMVGGIRLDP